MDNIKKNKFKEIGLTKEQCEGIEAFIKQTIKEENESKITYMNPRSIFNKDNVATDAKQWSEMLENMYKKKNGCSPLTENTNDIVKTMFNDMFKKEKKVSNVDKFNEILNNMFKNNTSKLTENHAKFIQDRIDADIKAMSEDEDGKTTDATNEAKFRELAETAINGLMNDLHPNKDNKKEKLEEGLKDFNILLNKMFGENSGIKISEDKLRKIFNNTSCNSIGGSRKEKIEKMAEDAANKTMKELYKNNPDKISINYNAFIGDNKDKEIVKNFIKYVEQSI